jgi:hypothetical protein
MVTEQALLTADGVSPKNPVSEVNVPQAWPSAVAIDLAGNLLASGPAAIAARTDPAVALRAE